MMGEMNMNQEEMDLLKRGSIIISSKDEMERRELFHSVVPRFINSITPDSLRIYFLGNLKDYGWSEMAGDMKISVKDDLQESLDALNCLLYDELVFRKMLFDRTEDEDQDPVMTIRSYNRLMDRRKRTKVPYILVIISELDVLMKYNPEETEEAVCRLAQLGEDVGIYMVIGIKNPEPGIYTEFMKKHLVMR
jgi:hypothetical protein